MNNKKRLNEIVKLVGKDKRVIDIGTDHGLVPLYLAKNNYSKEIIATDISEKSLQKLRDNLDSNLEKIIETKVCNGFEGLLQKENQIAVIAGMGAITIIEIIDKRLDFAKSLDYMILEGNIGNEKLRKYLNENSFIIEEDFLVYENKKYYDILKVKNGKDENYSLADLYFGKKNIDKRSKRLEEKLKIEYPKNLKFLENIEKYSKNEEGKDLILEKIKAIEEVYERWK